jgi:hypothetical protein
MHDSLPFKSVRELGALLVYFVQLASHGTKLVFERLAPFVRPPDDMEVRCRDGGQYTGLLVIQDNGVEGGAVVRTGQELPGYSPPRPPEHPWSSSRRDHDDARSGSLPHWSTDPRDTDHDSWRR